MSCPKYNVLDNHTVNHLLSLSDLVQCHYLQLYSASSYQLELWTIICYSSDSKGKIEILLSSLNAPYKKPNQTKKAQQHKPASKPPKIKTNKPQNLATTKSKPKQPPPKKKGKQSNNKKQPKVNQN